MRSIYLATCPVSEAADLQSMRMVLGAQEAALLSERATPRRRAEFWAGRSAARRAVKRILPDADSIEVLRERGPGAGRPRVVLAGRPSGVEVSISHTDGMAIAAASLGLRLGLDSVTIEPRGAAFRAEAFATGEWARWQSYLQQPCEDLVTSVAFAAKEAALKWIGCGLRVPLQGLTVTPLRRDAGLELDDLAIPLTVVVRQAGAGLALSGWRWRRESQVLVLLSGQPGQAPPLIVGGVP